MIRHVVAVLAAMVLPIGASLAHAEPDRVSVKVESGALVGRSEAGVDSFKGVPFAAPPTGPLRWAPPQPAPAWSGERDASAFGPACPQQVDPGGKPNGGGYVGPISEDCLSLNVYAPHGTHGAPVIVWLFGGGNVAGANAVPSYDGTAFARDGVVLVSVNNRIGALGFFAHPALTQAAGPNEPLANYGIMDLIAALQWVKHNIATFGGDPDNVMIAGESAGGMNVLTLLTTPAAQGLFQKAAVESGGGWERPSTLEQAERSGAALTTRLGLPVNASPAQLRALPVDKLVVPGGYGPILDGRLISEGYARATARGHLAPVPLIIGSNDFEGSLLKTGDDASYIAGFPPSVRALYAAEAKDDADLGVALFSDGFGGAPARWIAAHAAAKAPAFLYRFTYVRVVKRGKIVGANHASDIPYVFDSQMSVPVYKLEIQDEDRAMARRIHSCWVAFAKTGAPACDGGPAWPAYTPASDMTMDFGLTLQVREHLRKAQYDAIEQARAPKP